MLLNLVFSLLAIFHLTYLGSMFDPGLDEQEVEEVRATWGPSPRKMESVYMPCKCQEDIVRDTAAPFTLYAKAVPKHWVWNAGNYSPLSCRHLCYGAEAYRTTTVFSNLWIWRARELQRLWYTVHTDVLKIVGTPPQKIKNAQFSLK